MRASEMTTWVAFDQWVNQRLLDTAEALTDEQYRDPDAPTNLSLRDSFVHLLDTGWGYRLILEDRPDEDLGVLDPDDFPTLASLRKRWEVEDAALNAWLGTLTDADLDLPIVSRGELPALPRWIVLMHVLTHARQLQADIATILSGLGHSPGDIDFFDFLRERAARADAQ